jgi:hypothetical protein
MTNSRIARTYISPNKREGSPLYAPFTLSMYFLTQMGWWPVVDNPASYYRMMYLNNK